MTFNPAWGAIPENFVEPQEVVTNVLKLCYRDAITKKLHWINSDADYSIKECIDTVKDFLIGEKVKFGAIMAVIK